jgi:hypothetical protein
MTFWSQVYLVLATNTLALSIFSRRPQLMVGGGIIAFSWVQSTVLVLTHAPPNDFLNYFGTDFVWTEVLLFMLLRRFSVWGLVFWSALVCQLGAHIWYWQFEPSPRRYHEVVNGFYWVQILAVDIAAVVQILRRPARVVRFKPRIVTQPSIQFYRPARPIPAGPRLCPLLIRAYAI